MSSKGLLGLGVLVLEGNQHEAIGTKVDVLIHETCIHAEEVKGDSIMNKLVFTVDSIADVADGHTDRAGGRESPGRQDNCGEGML